MECVVRIFGSNILIHIDRRQVDVRHADFLPLVDKGTALLEDIAGGETRAGLSPVSDAAVAVYYSGMIVILQIQCVPGLALKSVLPLRKCPLELSKTESVPHILRQYTVRHHGIELNHHVEDTILAGDVSQGGLNRRHGCLANLNGVIFFCNLAEFMQVIHELRPVFIIGQTVDGRQPRDSVRKVFHFGYEGNYIFPESVHAHVEPEAHDFFDLVADDRIVHVKVRLFPCKYMEIELFPLLAVLPSQSLELAEPVVGRQTLSLYSERVTPDIIVAVGIVPAFPALQEPRMLVGCMVYDEVHEDIHSEFMGLVQNFFELIQCTVIGMDVSVVGNVISVVCIR